MQGGSLFTNSTIQEIQIKGGLSTQKNPRGTQPSQSLAINKTAQERELAKRTLQEKHISHLNKVQNRKNTLSQSGGLSSRTMRGG
jgi:hypothetical protein